MTPSGDETKGEMRAIAREEAAKNQADDAARAERMVKEKHSTQIGWAIALTGAAVLFLTLVAYLFLPVKPTVPAVLGLAGFAVLLAFGGGALVQGTRLDRILQSWKKDVS
jgi:fatty acid desaturase